MSEITPPPIEPTGDNQDANIPVGPTEDQVEDQEWDAAAEKLFPSLNKLKEEQKTEDEQTQSEKKSEEGQPAKTNSEDKKSDEKPGAGDDTEQQGDKDNEAGDESEEDDEGDDAESTRDARDARIAARQSAQQVEKLRSDVREKIFADVPTELQDADGDPIRTVEDVMKLKNPRTGEAFTEEEAGMWLLSAQQQFNRNLAEVDKRVEQIADVNLDLKDQADSITYEYGELLKQMPELRDKLWAEYEKTLVKDEKSGLILQAPVSLEGFYRTLLEPYAQMGRRAEEDEATKAAAEAEAKKQEEQQRQQKRADRSDIYRGGKTDNEDPEDKEWAEAAKTVFG